MVVTRELDSTKSSFVRSVKETSGKHDILGEQSQSLSRSGKQPRNSFRDVNPGSQVGNSVKSLSPFFPFGDCPGTQADGESLEVSGWGKIVSQTERLRIYFASFRHPALV